VQGGHGPRAAAGGVAPGDRLSACSDHRLLEALTACAGVTLNAVTTAIGLDLRGARVNAEGDLELRGTLAVDREAPVDFCAIRLKFALDTDADEEQLASLIKLTERYCLVYQTLAGNPKLSIDHVLAAGAG